MTGEMRLVFLCLILACIIGLAASSSKDENETNLQPSNIKPKPQKHPATYNKLAFKRHQLLVKRRKLIAQLKSGKFKSLEARRRVLKKLRTVHSKLRKLKEQRRKSLRSRARLSDAPVPENLEIGNNEIPDVEFRKCNCEDGCGCLCPKGFRFVEQNETCVDIDECAQNNGNCEHSCVNKIGYYYCSCPKGLKIGVDGRTCIDINECLLNNGHGPCQDTCINTQGSYMCSCDRLTGTKLSSDKRHCDDIDECVEGTSGCSHGCINVLRRAFCTCPSGMFLGPDWKTCLDINECDIPELNKNCPGCINTIGSYHCPLLGVDLLDTSVICPPLHPPQEKGYFQCARRSGPKLSRILNTPGVVCQFYCSVDDLPGGLIVYCGTDGHWKSTENRNITCAE